MAWFDKLRAWLGERFSEQFSGAPRPPARAPLPMTAWEKWQGRFHDSQHDWRCHTGNYRGISVQSPPPDPHLPESAPHAPPHAFGKTISARPEKFFPE